MDFDIFTVQGCMVTTSQTTALLMDWVAGAGGSSLLRVTMHLSDVWLALGVLQGNKAGILTTETLTLTLFQFGKCFLLQQLHLCTTPPSLSLFPPFPLSPDVPTPLNPLAKSLWEQETWRANHWAQLQGYHWWCILRSCVPAASVTMWAVPPGAV